MEIGIFGSFVRGEQKDTSDLDLLIDFEEPIGLIRYVGLQNYLSDKVGERVDLVKVRPQTEDRRAYPERGNLLMKERHTEVTLKIITSVCC